MQFVFRDLETNIVPILLSELSLGIEGELFTLLGLVAAGGGGTNWDSVTVAGAAIANTAAEFSDGTGAPAGDPLDDFAGTAVQPDQDIQL